MNHANVVTRLRILVSVVVISVMAGSVVAADSPSANTPVENVNWESFLAQHDPVWTRLPLGWHEGPFIGNGTLGTIAYVDPEHRHGLRFEIGRSDVYDHRENSKLHPVLSNCRLPIGHFQLIPVGTIKDGSARIDLWNAEIHGEITTDRGSIHWKAFASEDRVMVIEAESSPGEEACRFVWNAEQAISPYYILNWNGGKNDNPEHIKEYRLNPQPTTSQLGDVNISVQELLAGGDYATAWRIEKPATQRQVLYVTVGNNLPQAGSAAGAVADLKQAVASGVDRLREKHRRWWHDFYRQSFVSIPDTRLEGFYWIQLYKMASGTRENGALLDLLGPWFKYTGWPAIWWDLNVQLTYWPMLASNHVELGEPLYRLLDEKQAALISNAPKDYQYDSAFLGGPSGPDLHNSHFVEDQGKCLLCLPWALHNYWLHYRYTMDDDRLREKLFPLMKRAWNIYLHVLEKKGDGKYHLPLCYSAEYGCAEDTNQDLAIIRWGCQTLLDTCQRLKIDDPLIPRWQEVLKNLVDYPQDKNGLMVGKDMPFARSHRHFSHLFAIYPFRVLNAEQGPETRKLMCKSIDHWLSLDAELTGFSFSAGSSLISCLGDGDRAVTCLNKLLDPSAMHFSHLEPNTFYTECSGNRWPTIETPLSAVQSLFDMLIQSWGGTIRVFPAIPSTWRDITIDDLRTEGAFLVSAVRRDGVTRFVRITSLAGEPCRVRCDLAPNPQVIGDRTFHVQRAADGLLSIDLRKGESIILRSAEAPADMTISAVRANPALCNYFGAKKGR